MVGYYNTRINVVSALFVAMMTSSHIMTNAFAPAVPKSSFLGKPAAVAIHPTSTTTTALSMNIFDRFSRVAKSGINDILKNLEDPERIMTQALEDMQTDLVKVRQSYAEVTATQRRLMKQKEQADAVANDWKKRAQLALEKGNEELAKEALVRRQTAVEESEGLQKQLEFQNSSIDKLYEGMQMLERKILEAKSKKEQMVARARTAQSTQKVNDMISGVTGKTSMDAFKRMEDKVESLEAQAEVSREMSSVNALSGSSDLEKEFKLLEASSSVDEELEAMKRNLLTGSKSESPSSSSTSPQASSKAVDDELEKLKKDAGL
jgi:phage shock protein A